MDILPLEIAKHDVDNVAFRKFIANHINDDITLLNLRYAGKKLGFSLPLALTQIEAQRKVASKLPPFVLEKNIFFPNTILAEQCTAADVAQYHASTIGNDVRQMADLTLGLGVDAFTAAAKGIEVEGCEIDPMSAFALQHNARVLDLNITVHNMSAEEWLNNSTGQKDLIFIDPARRKNSKRVHALEDCNPNLNKILPQLQLRTQRLMVKVSPMLDTQYILRNFNYLSRLSAISLKGECKELLLELDFGLPPTTGTMLRAVEIQNDKRQRIIEAPCTEAQILPCAKSFTPSQGMYIYEPDAALMKLQLWGSMQRKYPQLIKPDTQCQLFFSKERIENFPGRLLRIEQVFTSLKRAEATLRGIKSNVASRNYPLRADEIRKRCCIKASPEASPYIFAAGINHKNFIFFCR